MDENKTKRLEELQHYGFNCDCKACSQNFPTAEFAKNGFWFQDAKINYNFALEYYFCRSARGKAIKRLKNILQQINNIPLEYSHNRDFDYFVKCIILLLVLIFYVKEKF